MGHSMLENLGACDDCGRWLCGLQIGKKYHTRCKSNPEKLNLMVCLL